MKTFKEFCNLSEEGGAPAMSVGAGGFQGLGSAKGTDAGGTIAGYDKLLNRGKVLRRKPLMTGLKPRKK